MGYQCRLQPSWAWWTLIIDASEGGSLSMRSTALPSTGTPINASIVRSILALSLMTFFHPACSLGPTSSGLYGLRSVLRAVLPSAVPPTALGRRARARARRVSHTCGFLAPGTLATVVRCGGWCWWHQPGGWSVDDGLSRVTVSDCCCCWRRRRRQLITLRRATVLYSCMQWLALRSVRYCRGTE